MGSAARDRPTLFQRFPQARGLPWVSLGTFPTPVQPFPILDGALPAIKRDDLSSPAYGGNKVRALEFLLGDALAQDAQVVLTGGAIGSHHVCALATFAHRLGLTVEAVLWAQPWSARCRESLHALAHLGVRVCYRPSPAGAVALLLWRWAIHRLQGDRVSLILPGGATPRAALGYADAALELDEQIRTGEADAPDSIWLPAGTGISATGLALGLSLAGRDARVRAVRVTPRIACNQRHLRRLGAGAERILSGAGVPVLPPMAPGRPDTPTAPSTGPDGPTGLPVKRRLPELLHGQFAPGYGRPSAAAEDAVARAGRLGIRLDTTYSGRALAGMLRQAPREGGRHLFWHTLSAAPLCASEEQEIARLPAPLRLLLARSDLPPTTDP